MNKQTKALKLAIEALESCSMLCATHDYSDYFYESIGDALKACKEALATEQVREDDVQPAQEPVGYIDKEQLNRWEKLRGTPYEAPERAYIGFSKIPFKSDLTDCSLAVYTHPAPSCQECENLKHDLEGYMDANKALINREWQGLESEKVTQIIHGLEDKLGMPIVGAIAVVRAIEQELKRKNGFNDVKEKNTC